MKKFSALPDIEEIPSEKSFFPHPPILPFAPMIDMNIMPNFRHRKYIEKKVDSTGGSALHEIDNYRKPISPKISPSPVSPKFYIKKNQSQIKQIRGRRYISAGRCTQKEPPLPRSSHSKPSKIKIKKISLNIRSKSTRKTNKSADFKLSDMRLSPKIKDASLILNRIR